MSVGVRARLPARSDLEGAGDGVSGVGRSAGAVGVPGRRRTLPTLQFVTPIHMMLPSQIMALKCGTRQGSCSLVIVPVA